MVYVPGEIWENISKGLSSFELPILRPFGRGLTWKEKRHKSIWDKVMENQIWLDAMTDLGLNPVLIGPSFRNPKYLCLVVNDYSGDAQYQKAKLFSDLRSKSPQEGPEIKLKGGITLNVIDALRCPLYIRVRPERLFSGKRHRRLQTRYIYWRDDSYNIGHITHKDIGPCKEAVSKRILRSSNKDFECEVTLPLPDHELPKQRRHENRINLQTFEHERNDMDE